MRKRIFFVVACSLLWVPDSSAIDPENWEPTVSLVGKTCWIHLTDPDMDRYGLKDGMSLQFQFSYN